MGHTSLLGKRGGCVIVAAPHFFQQLARAMRTDLASQVAANVMCSNEDACRCPAVVAAAKNTCGCGIERDTCACLGCAMRHFLGKGNSHGTESERNCAPGPEGLQWTWCPEAHCCIALARHGTSVRQHDSSMWDPAHDKFVAAGGRPLLPTVAWSFPHRYCLVSSNANRKMSRGGR
jgi:hypothetical protein